MPLFASRSAVGVREDAALADQQPVAGHRGASRSVTSSDGLEGAQVAVVDADQPRVSSASARSSSASSCTSTSTSMPRSLRRVVELARRRRRRRAAMMIRMQSAPQARASAHLVGVEQEILAQRRQARTAARACVRYSGAPWKDGASVSTERQAAPPAS